MTFKNKRNTGVGQKSYVFMKSDPKWLEHGQMGPTRPMSPANPMNPANLIPENHFSIRLGFEINVIIICLKI